MNQPAEEDFDTTAAAALIRRTTEDTRRSLAVQVPQLYAGWGVAWLVGLLAMWFSVRDQRPYHGATAGATLLFVVLLIGALAITIVTINRATRGLHGHSQAQSRIFGISWGVGFVALFVVEGALAHSGADSSVRALVSAAGPLLVTALVYLEGAVIWLDRKMLTMGVWLALVAAVGAWTGPVTVLLVSGLAGGGGFLVMAGYVVWRKQG